MHLVVIADGKSQNEFTDKPIPGGVQVQLVTGISEAHAGADAYFYLHDEEKLEADKNALSQLGSLVFVNAVVSTLQALPANCVRINGWPGFLLGKAIEIAAGNQHKDAAISLLGKLGWKYNLVPDVPGFISARTIAMIINEAYFAVAEDVSSKQDIDTAMKLGTGYPYGPFEWSEIIGLKRIYHLLQTLSETDKRYLPAPLLATEKDL